jgi:hypothetical protein
MAAAQLLFVVFVSGWAKLSYSLMTLFAHRSLIGSRLCVVHEQETVAPAEASHAASDSGTCADRMRESVEK